MGIDQRHTVSVLDVRNHHVFDQGGFSGSGFANNVDVSATVLFLDPKQLADIPVIGDGEVGDLVRIIVCLVHLPIVTPEKGRSKGGISDFEGKMSA